MGTPARHSGAAVRCIREGARECVPGGRGGRADVHSGSRSARPGRPGRVSDRPIDVRKRPLASPCRREHQSEVHVRCVVVGAKRKSLAVRCDARPPSLDARSVAVLADAARHGSRMHNPRCGATRLLWHRQSRHLASIHAPCAGGDIRVPHWIDGEPQIMPPRAEARVFDTHLHPRTPLQASRSLSRRRRSRASGEGGCVSSPGSDPRRCGPQCNVCAFPVRVRDRRAEHA